MDSFPLVRVSGLRSWKVEQDTQGLQLLGQSHSCTLRISSSAGTICKNIPVNISHLQTKSVLCFSLPELIHQYPDIHSIWPIFPKIYKNNIISTLQVVTRHFYLGDVAGTAVHNIQTAMLSGHKSSFAKPQNTMLTNHLLLKAMVKSHLNALEAQ